MPTAQINPAWVPAGRRLKTALAKSGVSQLDIADKLGVHNATISNYCCGRSLPRGDTLAKLKPLLKLDADTVTMIKALNGDAATKGRPTGTKNGTGATVARSEKSSTGPAQRAMALHAARGERVQVPPPSRLRQDHPGPDPGVFGMEMKADGTMHIWVRATLPVDKGTALLRALLDMNIIDQTQRGSADTDDHRDTQDTE